MVPLTHSISLFHTYEEPNHFPSMMKRDVPLARPTSSPLDYLDKIFSFCVKIGYV